jgi:hypothetical protein
VPISINCGSDDEDSEDSDEQSEVSDIDDDDEEEGNGNTDGVEKRSSPRLQQLQTPHLCREEDWSGDDGDCEGEDSDSSDEGGNTEANVDGAEESSDAESEANVSSSDHETAVQEAPSISDVASTSDAMDVEQMLNRYWMLRGKVQRLDKELAAIHGDFRGVAVKRPARDLAYNDYVKCKGQLAEHDVDPKDQDSPLCRSICARWRLTASVLPSFK